MLELRLLQIIATSVGILVFVSQVRCTGKSNKSWPEHPLQVVNLIKLVVEFAVGCIDTPLNYRLEKVMEVVRNSMQLNFHSNLDSIWSTFCLLLKSEPEYKLAEIHLTIRFEV